MVRTADSWVRSSSGKAGKKSGGGSSSAVRVVASSAVAGAQVTERGTGGLNPICQRETPDWQKPITSFFTKAQESAKGQTQQVKDSDNVSESDSS